MGAGEDWRKRREEMGKTLEEAALELRISQKYLRGMEEGDYSRWPPKVFSTGFIRAYALFLSVDADPVLLEYFAFLEKRSVDETPFQAKPEWLERERRRGSRRTAYTIATVAVLVIGVFLAWYGRHTTPRPPSPPEVGETSPPSPIPIPAPIAIIPPSSDNVAGSGLPAAKPPPVPEQKPVTASGGSGPESAPSHTLSSLFLEARELTWIMYSHNGSEPVDVMLYPGDRISIQARKTIYLKIGNAGGVIGTLNGNLLPPFGQKGQVKEITLGE
jgi:transcriptional regulator with XRE-family HTH domain